MGGMDDFSHKTGTALVTGGSGGIGAAICSLLAERGSDVAFTYRSNATAAAEVSAAVEGHGRTASAQALDLTDEDAVAGYLEQVAADGGIHTIVHAAGPLVPMIHLSKVPPSQFRDQVDQDVFGFYNLVHFALPHLRASRGSLTVVTTAATARYPVRDGLSAGPKGSIESLARAIAAEEGRFGVRVNCVGPGMTLAGMAQVLIGSGQLDERALDVAKGNIPLGTFGDADDIAQAVLFLASDRADYITGQKLDVDGGYGI